MDKNKVAAILYYVASAICFIAAVIWFCGSKTTLGIIWLCVGSTNLILGTLWMKKSNKPEE